MARVAPTCTFQKEQVVIQYLRADVKITELANWAHHIHPYSCPIQILGGFYDLKLRHVR